jgi:putative transposase
MWADITRAQHARSELALPTDLTNAEWRVLAPFIRRADIQDRDGAPLVLAATVQRFPWLQHIFADGGYAGDKLKDEPRSINRWTIEIV